MALLYIDSFDHYDAPHILSKWTSSFTGTDIALGKGRCQTNCLALDGYDDLHKGLPFASPSCTVGFAMKVNSDLTIAHNTIAVVGLIGSSGGDHIYIIYYADDGSLAVWREIGSNPIHPNFLGRTLPDTIRQDCWYYIELQATIAAAGMIALRVNNVELLRATNIYTIGDNADNSPKAADLRAIHFRSPANASWYVDDLYVLDSTGAAPWTSFLGDSRVEYLRPAAAGTYQEWGLIGPDPSHWQAVDDNNVPDDDATYLTTTIPGKTDTQVHSPTGLPAGGILYGAQLSILARKTDDGPRLLAPVLRQDTSDHVGGSQAPSVTYRYLHQTYQVNPITGLPWTIEEINAGEYGVTVTA